MYSLVLLFFLMLWVLVIIGATRLGRYIGLKYFKTPRAGQIGARTGFMLTFGGWVIYWIVEFIAAQAYVSYLCQGAGITVYVTPEQFRKEIGEERWNELSWYFQWPDDYKNSDRKDQEIIIDGITYSLVGPINADIDKYRSYHAPWKVHLHTGRRDYIYVSRDTKQILFRETTYGTGVGNPMTGGGWKVWLNNIHDCDWTKYAKQLDKLELQYSNNRYYKEEQ